MTVTFEFHGESFAYADEFPEFAYAEFCEAMDDGLDTDAARSTAVTLRLALASITEADQGRFRRACRKNRVSTEGYLKVFKDFMAALSERPTGRPSDSSDGPDVTPQTSESQPVASVTSLPEVEPTRGSRPDLALAISRSA